MRNKQLGLLLVLVIAFFSCQQGSKCEIAEEVTYAKDIAPVIEAKCFMCHAPDVYKKKASRVKIYDYKSLVSVAQDKRLLGSIKHEQGFIAMPYKKGEKIDECSILLIESWITQGFKK